MTSTDKEEPYGTHGQRYVSINKEMPEGLKKMVIGHSQDMDTEGTYSHAMEGDMKKVANYTGAALDAIIKAKK